MAQLSLQSPGVEIVETDLSLYASTNTPTNIFITGFTQYGPTDQIIQPASLSDFENTFGLPTNAAERYAYQTVKAAFNSPAGITFSRMPYGSGSGLGFSNAYSALVFPVTTFDTTTNTFTPYLTGNNAGDNMVYFVGPPTHIDITPQDYQNIQNGNAWGWSVYTNTVSFTGVQPGNLSVLGNAGIIVLNTARTSIDNNYQGYYVSLIDNSNINPATNYDAVGTVKSVQANTPVSDPNFVAIPSTRLNFYLSGGFNAGVPSLGQTVEQIPTFNIANRTFDDTIVVGLFQLQQSNYSTGVNALNFTLAEGYVGSLDYNRQITNSNGALVSFFINNVDSTSPNIQTMVNPYLAARYGTTWLNSQGLPGNKVRFYTVDLLSIAQSTSAIAGVAPTVVQALSTCFNDYTNDLYAVGSYSSSSLLTKTLGSIPTKLSRILNLVSDRDLYAINVFPEAGLGTIFTYQQESILSGYGDFFNETQSMNIGGLYITNNVVLDPNALRILTNYNTIASQIVQFCQFTRQDCFAVLDIPRYCTVLGKNSKVTNDITKNFSQNIYWPSRLHTDLINSSYAAAYSAWAQVYDANSATQVWIPFSGFASAAYANTDTNFYPWFAPAGYTRGLLLGVNDISVYPNQSQRDQLYLVNINPILNDPLEGFVIFGQKTLQKMPSALDRINVRRMFLVLETQTRNIMKFFVFEPNTLYTQTRVVNTLSPIFDLPENTEGLYDYLIICDSRNNPPSTVDQNQLNVSVYLKPVKAAEFILVNFIATTTGQDFAELIANNVF